MSHCPRQPDLWSLQEAPQPEGEGRSLVASAPWPGRGPRRRARASGNRSTPVPDRRPPTSFRPPGPDRLNRGVWQRGQTRQGFVLDLAEL